MQPRSLSLQAVMRSGQWVVAGVAVVVVCAVVTVGATLRLKAAQRHALELMARSVAYSSEAAVAFEDAAEAGRLLQAIGVQEGLDLARLELPDGSVLAQYARSDARASGGVPSFSLSPTVTLPVQVRGEPAGRLVLSGDTGFLRALFAWAGIGVLAGLCAAGVAVWLAARRQSALVLAPLKELSDATRAIREARSFDRRIEPARVAELDALAADFNALLGEVQAYEAELVGRQRSLAQAYEEASVRSRHDALTGVANRRYFEERLAESISRAQREQERVGLLFVDADRFKQINDRYGHETGDRVLRTLAERLSGGVRSHDVVARLGGDEFVVLIAPLHDAQVLSSVARHLAARVREPMPVGDGRSLEIAVSIGAAVFPEHGKDVASLLRAADHRMYEQKKVTR